MTKDRRKWGDVQMQRNVSWEGSKAGGVFKAGFQAGLWRWATGIIDGCTKRG